MKKNILKIILLSILCQFIACSNVSALKMKKIFKWDMPYPFVNYYFQNNEMFIYLLEGGYYLLLKNNNNNITILLEGNPSLRNISTADAGSDKFGNKYTFIKNDYLGFRRYDSPFKVKDNLYLNIPKYEYVQIIENGKLYDLSDISYKDDLGAVIYIDHINLKAYFRGKIKDDNGIVLCDLKTKKAELIIKDKKFKSYFSPVRVPNTDTLMFYQTSDDIYHLTDTTIFIVKIPEWTKEIERQKKNITKYPNAKRYYLNGPANIRNAPKGEVISTIGDKIEVLILDQQGDWYKILYADVEGWTYKDNIRKDNE